jgi:hypothetical protein
MLGSEEGTIEGALCIAVLNSAVVKIVS